MPVSCYLCIFLNVGLGELSLAGTASGVIGLNGYVTIPLIISGSRRTLIIQWGQA
ncbi:phage tail protein, partial [Escherichia coli]